MATIYKRFSLNLHRFKDDKYIKYLEDRKENDNLSYSDTLRLALVTMMNLESGNATVKETKPKSSKNKPKFKFKEV